jgi:hypothetical protein
MLRKHSFSDESGVAYLKLWHLMHNVGKVTFWVKTYLMKSMFAKVKFYAGMLEPSPLRR